jgi:hypothetical protein
MTDLQFLYLVLVVVYAWECACWVRRGSVVFRSWFGRKWRIAHPGLLLGNQRGGVIFAHPLPPLGTLLTGNQFPLSLSPEAALAFVAPSVNPGGRPEQTVRLARFDEIRTAEAHGKKVGVNGEMLLSAPSPTCALRLAQLLRHWAKAPAAEREKQIQRLFSDRFDTKALERRWHEFQAETASLRWLTNVLFGYLFLFGPLLVWHFGLKHSWPGLLVGLLGCTTATAVLFHRMHKRFYPDAEDERFTHFLLILLAPATTIRALDTLSRPLLEEFHPLAVAKVFCPEPAFREFARRVLLDLRHPARPLCPRPEPAAQEAESRSRLLLREAVEQFLQRCGIKLEELAAAPTPTDASCLSYCPRCQAQFTTLQGVCDDCGGLALTPFAVPLAEAPCKTP